MLSQAHHFSRPRTDTAERNVKGAEQIHHAKAQVSLRDTPSTDSPSLKDIKATQEHEEENQLCCEWILFGRTHGKGELETLDFNVMYRTPRASRPVLIFDLKKRLEVRLTFAHFANASSGRYILYSFSIFLSDLIGQIVIEEKSESKVLMIRSTVPPRISMLHLQPKGQSASDRQALGMTNPSDGSEIEDHSWIRCSEILQEGREKDASQCQIHLYRSDVLFEVGRCNTFQISLKQDQKTYSTLNSILQQLEDLNLRWTSATKLRPPRSLPANLYASLWHTYYARSFGLPFEVSYLLDAALSLNCLDETQIDQMMDFCRTIDVQKGLAEVLSEIVLIGDPILDPPSFIKMSLERFSQRPKAIEWLPEYCVALRKVIVTSTSSRSITGVQLWLLTQHSENTATYDRNV